MSNKAVFLDRDGTIIEDKGYLKNPQDITLIQGAGEALADLKKAGFLLIVITNQSGIGRGFFSLDTVHRQHDYLQRLLAAYNVQLDCFEICPHAPDENCSCRKPQADMISRAAEKFNIEVSSSFMIGDKESDIQAGRQAGCKTILISSRNLEKTEADTTVNNISEVADTVMGKDTGK